MLVHDIDLQDLAITLGTMCETDIQQKLGLIYRLHLPPCNVVGSPEAEFGVEAMQFFKPGGNDAVNIEMMHKPNWSDLYRC